MAKRKSVTDNKDNRNSSPIVANDAREAARERIERICKCDRILSDTDSDIVQFANFGKFNSDNGILHQSEDCRKDLEGEYLRVMEKLNLADDTLSLTKIETTLPQCMKYGIRSGSTHMNMQKFSPLSRGYQGPAAAVAAIATSRLVEPPCWNEVLIDRVVEDGDTYFGESYKLITTSDRKTVTLRDLKRVLDIKGSHRVTIRVDDPIYVGTFKSESPRELHVAVALQRFFETYDAGILTSPVLNVALWKGPNYYYLFDAQPRLDSCDVVEPDEEEGAAKLIILENLAGVLFVILEKSGLVGTEPFVLYGLGIESVKKLSDVPDEPSGVAKEPRPWPNGYLVREKYRAVVRGSLHLQHPQLPEQFHGRGHLVLAVAALVYSKLLYSRKWTSTVLDLIFNQSHVYLTDLARVLGKPLTESFALRIDELLCDFVLGVYVAKIKVRENVVPGQGKKGKAALNSGLRDFFEHEVAGVLEIKKTFFAIWSEDDKYYLFDPFGCDSDGFRVVGDPKDPDSMKSYATAVACVTMNASIDQLVEVILENTESKDKDPFIIHGLDILYVKTSPDDKVVYRQKGVNRRPPPPKPDPAEVDECSKPEDGVPRPRNEGQTVRSERVQFPETMHQVERFVDTYCPFREDQDSSDTTTGYKIVSPHRLALHGTQNCLSPEFIESSRGRQGLVIALAAIARAKLLNPASWSSADLDLVVKDANVAYERVVFWIRGGGDEKPFDSQTIAESLYASEKSRSILALGLNHMDLSMLPNTLDIGEADVTVAYRMRVVEGECNPLANLGEALERYFEMFDELIIENGRLSYGVWLEEKKYFTFNPYGDDGCGWRDNLGPSTLVVVDSVVELVNFLYGVFEFNDYHFALHYVKLSVHSAGEAESEAPEDLSNDILELEPFEKYVTKFLPVTDADLREIQGGRKGRKSSNVHGEDWNDGEDGDGANEEEEVQCVKDYSYRRRSSAAAEDSLCSGGSEKELERQFDDLMNLFCRPKEPQQLDPPTRLNLSLITGVVKVQGDNESVKYNRALDVFYEKLKYRQTPPFVTPPQKNLCELLDAKVAVKSMHSLLSRFSIDSRLAIKEMNNLPQSTEQDATVNVTDSGEKTKLITLPPKKYLFSHSLPTGLTPIRAIDEKYIQDKEVDNQKEESCRKQKLEKVSMVPGEVPDKSTGLILPSIVPLGPCIMTPKFKPKLRECPDKRQRTCPLSVKEKEDVLLKKIVCDTENILLELLLPGFKGLDEKTRNEEPSETMEKKTTVARAEDGFPLDPEPCGFSTTENEEIGVIRASMSLEDRETREEEHYKSCYFAAMICILAKINMEIYDFRSTVLDRFIFAANKIGSCTCKLRYKITRFFRNYHVLDVHYNVIVKQVRYADPENHEPDSLKKVLMSFFCKHQTGILVFGNVAYAFWLANGIFYLFDPYSCDENGRASEGGGACLMKICKFGAFVNRIVENTGESSGKPYRIYTLSICHLEQKKKKRRVKKKRRTKSCKEKQEQDAEAIQDCDRSEDEDLESEAESLIELADWTKEKPEMPSLETKPPGFLPVKNCNASVIEVEVLENDITRPVLAPFKNSDIAASPLERCVLYDRKFSEDSVVAEPMDLCVMAWSQIYEPPIWSVQTIRALYEASREYTLNSVFASEDTTIPQMWDGLLTEFGVANYSFRVAFAPVHFGTLYVTEGWNLAMSLEKIFESPCYSGAILVCGSAHVGVMKKNAKLYAWWFVRTTKNIRIIVSEDMEDYLKLIIKEINEPKETAFAIRMVTISYAKMIGPNCSDLEGLHESMMPSTTVPQIHTKDKEVLDSYAIFRPINKCKAPVFILGSVALSNRDSVKEPNVKRCYFAALLSVIMKRDIIQNPLPEMIDKILQFADSMYKLFEKPKYHTEHVLKDVTVNDRVFDLRDCTSDLTNLQSDKQSIDDVFYPAVKAQLKEFFKKHTSGIIHFSNCCYGFWYSRLTSCYYYLDPYQCDEKGKRVDTRGRTADNGFGCLCVFASICNMAKQMCINHFKETTGFFIHRIHVEAVNPSTYEEFQEDPVWNYLDYHWSYRHATHLISRRSTMSKKLNTEQDPIMEEKPMLKNYLLEVPNMIFSLWGSVGAFYTKFETRAGKIQAAIGVVALALQNICHPSEWDSVILDSAVICGDHFYKESRKTCSEYCNKFSLPECLKIPPHLWSLEFASDMCGVLYGSKKNPSLATRINQGFERSPNLFIQCGRKILTAIRTTDALYAIDSSWTGPPLFSRGRGAIYAIRCANVNTLIYVLMKMFNTNRKLEFAITPVKLTYRQEVVCRSSDSKSGKKLLEKTVRSTPGLAVNHPSLVAGSETVADEDSYLCYSRNLLLGLEHGEEYENPPELRRSSKADTRSSTGVRKKRKTCKKSSSSVLHEDVSYPRVVDLAKLNGECDTWSWNREFEITTSFVCDETRDVFNSYNEQMQKDVYKTIKHRNAEGCQAAAFGDKDYNGPTMSKTSVRITDLAEGDECEGDKVGMNDNEGECVDAI